MPTTMTPTGLRTCNELGELLVCWVFGPPRVRCVQCPYCCKRQGLGLGPFRGRRFTCGSCKKTFEVYWNAGIGSWA